VEDFGGVSHAVLGDGEMVYGRAVETAETVMGVGDGKVGKKVGEQDAGFEGEEFGEREAWSAAEEARAQNDITEVFLERGDEFGEVSGVELAIGVVGDDGVGLVSPGVLKTGLEGGALAEIYGVTENDGGGGNAAGCLIGGAVVDDYDPGGEAEDLRDDGGNGGGFVEGGDDDKGFHQRLFYQSGGCIPTITRFACVYTHLWLVYVVMAGEPQAA